MKKIEIFVGSDSAFEKIVPKSARNLSEMAAKLDDGNKKMDVFVNIPGQPEPKLKKKKKPRVQDFVIHADEYCSVQEHVIINFINFIFQMSITNMYIQNPPKNIREQIYRTFDKSIIHETQQPYLEVSKEMIQTFNSQYSERVIGQERAKKKLLQAIYPLVDGKQSKPVVILLYGDSGLGKTESAQYMAELMGGKLLRKQFSMYQNNESANYIFGGRYNEKSFAQDLLARETNVLLFDEFDKALSVFHSAFYQLFDEGIYEDHNYKVVVNKAIIVCTSNYKTIDEIKEHLGLPIYNRFDSIIKFDDLPDMAKEKIAEREIERLKKDYDIEDRELFDKIKEGAVTQSNAREIKHLIKETFSLVALKKIYLACKAQLKKEHEKLEERRATCTNLTKLVDELEAKQKNVRVALSIINRNLSYIFFSNDRFKIDYRNNNYVLLSNGKPVQPSKISQGERNIIGLCYFFASILENQEETTAYTKEYLLLIDDPVSSFDMENKTGIMSFLRYQLGKFLLGNEYTKSIIMTHDLLTYYDSEKMFGELIEASKVKYGGDKPVYKRYELKNKILIPFPHNGRQEYTELMKIVYRFALGDADEYELVIGNIMRQVLEAFSTFQYKKGIEEVSTDRSILAILPEKEYQSYFENLMYRLILNNGSHRLDQTRSMSDMNFFTVISDSEKKRTAKEILCFIYLLNEKHVLAHLDGCSNVQSNLSKWCNDVKNKVGA